jgi:uncharacterized phage infection (PIP) family protein YhgE
MVASSQLQPENMADLKATAAQLHQAVFGTQDSDVESIKQKEDAVNKLSEVYVKLQDAKALTDLLSQLRPFFSVIPKAKTAKIVRNIIDQIAKIPNSTEIQVTEGQRVTRHELMHQQFNHVWCTSSFTMYWCTSQCRSGAVT